MKSQERQPQPEERSELPPEVVTAERMTEKPKEAVRENAVEVNQEIERLTETIGKVVEAKKEVAPISPENRARAIEEYQEKYLPDHIKGKKGFFSKVCTEVATRFVKFETEGRENVPEEGPFLVVCNHFGDEGAAILKEFKGNNVHVALGREIWWNRSPVHRLLFKKLGMLPVEESLAHLSVEEKEESMGKQDSHGKKVFAKIIDRENGGRVAVDKEFIRSSVAALAKGDAVSIFPEGLWLNPEGSMFKPREKAEMKQGYQGMELIAQKYLELTGKELPIVPVAFDEDRQTGKKVMKIGKPIALSENNTNQSGTDYCLTKVARMLPEDQRGYYKEAASLQD